MLRSLTILLLAMATETAIAGEAVVRADQGVAKVLAATAVRDVALQAGDVLHGSVVDAQGMPQANLEVWIALDDGPTIKTRTDIRGRFSAAAIKPGNYAIDTASGGGKFRVWQAKDAPPEALTNVLLVVSAKRG
jgi:hypothetical protein